RVVLVPGAVGMLVRGRLDRALGTRLIPGLRRRFRSHPTPCRTRREGNRQRRSQPCGADRRAPDDGPEPDHRRRGPPDAVALAHDTSCCAVVCFDLRTARRPAQRSPGCGTAGVTGWAPRNEPRNRARSLLYRRGNSAHATESSVRPDPASWTVVDATPGSTRSPYAP